MPASAQSANQNRTETDRSGTRDFMLLVNAQRWHQRCWSRFLADGGLQSAPIGTLQGNSFCRPKAAKSQLEKPQMVMIYLVA
jgi:hypothetical protein